MLSPSLAKAPTPYPEPWLGPRRALARHPGSPRATETWLGVLPRSACTLLSPSGTWDADIAPPHGPYNACATGTAARGTSSAISEHRFPMSQLSGPQGPGQGLAALSSRDQPGITLHPQTMLSGPPFCHPCKRRKVERGIQLGGWWVQGWGQECQAGEHGGCGDGGGQECQTGEYIGCGDGAGAGASGESVVPVGTQRELGTLGDGPPSF